ncbi:MAG: penicillin-binding transpeptidase domain-containing protein [Roseiflexaceae bacterium]|nr:penicillin-binding transpeptidase domain-containing protein [Roseiflexus sp.]MDW8213822.1 penicillin-binding transpeptidase domain-containing protein [Roseiflexaceae bacterium]
MRISRILGLQITVILIFAILIGRLYQLQLVEAQADQFRYTTEVRVMRYLPTRPMRGEIFASDGRTLLAQTVPIYAVAIRPADLPADPASRAEVLAHLSQAIGITSTLIVSPATALDRDPVLRGDLIQGLGADAVARAQRVEPPLKATLALTPDQRAAINDLTTRYGPLIEVDTQSAMLDSASAPASSPLTATLTISPATALQFNPTLREDLARIAGDQAIAALGTPVSWLRVEASPSSALNALRLSTAYSDVLTLENPIAAMVERANIPGYQTLTIREDIPHAVALALIENAASLPGVVIEQDYRRRYPLSAETPSLSYILGYIGRVNQCELVRQNPARSWMSGLLESIGNSIECGIIQKQINPYELGLPRYLPDDRIGKFGVEASYEEELRGQLGMQEVLVDALGRLVRPPQTIKAPRDGYNLVLTIDVQLQRQAEIILRNWIDESERRRQTMPDRFAYKRNYDPIRSGVAIVVEVKTGRILAMVNWPAYDNNIWDPARSAELQELFFPGDPEKQKELARLSLQTNRAISGQYPPGSTLKQFDAAIALQKGVITADTQIRDPGKLLVEDQYMPGVVYQYVNASLRDNGRIDVRQALKVSSNVFFMSVAGGNRENVINLKPEDQIIEKGLGIAALAEGLGWFGFGEPTGVRLRGEEAGRVPTPAWKQRVLRSAWTTGDTYNAAIGQGNLEVTPLQLVMASAAIANDGLLYRPQIVRAITDANGNVIREIQPELIRRIPVDPKHLQVVREGLRLSVTEGPNIAARDQCSGLSIAGKTGTAEFGPLITIPGPDGRGTREVRQSHAWFVGFAPYEDPEIEVLVLVEGAGDMNDGSATIAVPAVTQIMQAYFGVTPPDPLPRGCQQGMPPLPPRLDPPSSEPIISPQPNGQRR